MNTLKPIKVAIEAFGRRDSNLITSEVILIFLYKCLQENNSNISNELLEATKKRIKERRNINLITLLKYLQNSNFLTEDLQHSSKQVIKQCAEQFYSRLFNDSSSEKADEDLNNNDVENDDESISVADTETLESRLTAAIKETEKFVCPHPNSILTNY